MKKKQIICTPDPQGQIHQQLSNVDRFLLAQATLKSANPPDWYTLQGVRYLAGLIDCSYSSARRLIKSGKIPSYKIGNIYFFLIQELIQAINTYPEIFRYVWNSYGDNEHSEDEMIVHWRKFLYPDHVLILFTFQRTTLTTIVPVNMWTRNYRIGNILIKEVNKYLKSLPDEKN